MRANVSGIFRSGLDVEGIFCVARLPVSKHSRGRPVARRNSLGCENILAINFPPRTADRGPTDILFDWVATFSAPHTKRLG
jgi:hypothetical protein